MPNPEGRHRYQPALLWMCTGDNGYGQFTVEAEPVEIRVQYSDQQAQALDKNGNTITLDSTAIVDREILVGSRLVLSTLDVWNEEGSDDRTSGLLEVKTFSKVPDIRNRAKMYSVGLLRFHNP